MKEVYNDGKPADRDMMLCMVLCNGAEFVRNADNDALPIENREVIGDATETALLKYVAYACDTDTVRRENHVVLEVPFNSDKKWAASVRARKHETGMYVVYFKVCVLFTLHYKLVICRMGYYRLPQHCYCYCAATA
jgi:magnesium-transporting ATPase (P-type)